MCIGFMYGSVWLRPQKLDHPTTLGIGGIGCAIASVGVHKVKPCSGRLLVGVAPGCCVGDDAWPSTPSEIVGWEMGARTCLHVRPGSLTILECRFNKTTHHQQSKKKPTLWPRKRASRRARWAAEAPEGPGRGRTGYAPQSRMAECTR